MVKILQWRVTGGEWGVKFIGRGVHPGGFCTKSGEMEERKGDEASLFAKNVQRVAGETEGTPTPGGFV